MITQYFSRLFSALLVIVLSVVLTASLGYQLITGQNPCPLCFLQRVAMIGVGIGQLLNFRFGIQIRHHAISLFHCIFGFAVSLRQICLHICPEFDAFGTPVLGFSLYTWAFIVFICAFVAIGVLMWLYDPKQKPLHSKPLDYLEKFASIYLLLIILDNIVTTAMVCGWICPENP